jgi:hypothetical protein
MKKRSVLVAVLIATIPFSCTSEIESPDSNLQRNSSSSEVESSSSNGHSSSSDEVSSSSWASSSSRASSSSVAVGYDVISNKEFAGGVLTPWEKGFGDLNATNRGKIELVETPPHGYDAIFTPSGKEVNNWDLQLIHRNLNIKPGYSYKFELGGNTTKGGMAPVMVVLMNCTTISDCTNYIQWEGNFSSTYTDYASVAWKNCSVNNSNTTFVISGGDSEVEFKISWVSIWAEPVNCP